ncbi:MAG TPA: DNA polymerase IV [Microlunatus sp.]|nr:DNA polymerase IV [Microlunatus sp.]
MTVVMHVDMDCFYVSVELRRHPELRGRPVVVGGYPRGVVLSASYEARALGIRSGMPSAQALRQAPNLSFLRPSFEEYTAISKAIVAVFSTFSSVVEAVSIDEAFLDVTGSERMFGSAVAIGETIRAVVADEQRITCSVGIGPTKFVAKVASKAAKPDGLVEVPPDGVSDFLHPMPVEAMWGVGRSTTEKLNRIGIFSVGDLARTPRDTLRRAFGPHAGSMLHHLAWGRDARRVVVRPVERSIGHQETLGRDTDDPDVVRREILRMADKAARRMRAHEVLGRTITLSIRCADFTELTRSAQAPTPTDVAAEIYAVAVALYERLGIDRARIRRVGVRVEGLVDRGRAERQPQLTDPARGWREAEQATDVAVGRFGPDAVRRASLALRRSPAATELSQAAEGSGPGHRVVGEPSGRGRNRGVATARAWGRT